jgi:hypothetical protein
MAELTELSVISEKYMKKKLQFNLEKFGGNNVEFSISRLEFEFRVKNDLLLCVKESEKFINDKKISQKYVKKNIKHFPSLEFCEGHRWKLFREAIVDCICKNTALSIKEKFL